LAHDISDSTTRASGDSTTRNALGKTIEPEGVRRRELASRSLFNRGRGPWPWSHPPSPAGVHKAQTLRPLPEPSSSHSLFHDSFLAFFFRNSTCTLSPSIPQTLAVVVWVRPIDDDDPLPLLRPYSKRPRGCDISTLPIPLAPVLGGLI
jgi:hypothetical protein